VGVGFLPNFQHPLAVKLCIVPQKSFFGGARTSSRSSITVISVVGLGFHPPPRGGQNVEFFVCLSYMLLNVRVCAPDFAMKAARR